ncbi:MAG: hypothetical protein FJ014_12360 [Chloroflexi bacterium]|nr:hypothetical protein [Chloroflexota bacterium]
MDKPRTVTWAVICHHHDEDYTLPDTWASEEEKARTRSVFLSIIADHLAATAGRVLGQKVGAGEGPDEVHRLWRPKFAQTLKKEARPIKSEPLLRKALALLGDASKKFSDYQAEYGDSLLVRAEDADWARRVTSLLSHMVLTGQFYRVLDQAVETLDNPPRLALHGVEVRGVREAEKEWVGRLVRAQVYFHQQPVRPADLGIFERLIESHNTMTKAYPNHLLFAIGNTLWLFLPGKEPPEEQPAIRSGEESEQGTGRRLKDVLAIYTDAGFYVQCELRDDTMQNLGVWISEAIRAQVKEIGEQEQKELEAAIAAKNQEIERLGQKVATLGEQIRQVTSIQPRQVLIDNRKALSEQRGEAISTQRRLREQKQVLEDWLRAWLERKEVLGYQANYPVDILKTEHFDPHMCEICQMRPGKEVRFGTATDYLCPLCAGIRQGGFSQRELSEWLKQERGNVLWMKVNLNPELLEATLAKLFAAYVDTLKAEAGKRVRIKAGLRLPALLRDFVGDYRALLEELEAEVERVAGGRKQMATLAEDTWVFPIRDGEQVYGLLNRYCELLGQRFPVFWPDPDMGGQVMVSNPPIRLGISIGSAKYPFYQHWRYVSAPPAPVSVWVVGREPLEVDLVGLEALLKVNFSAKEARQGRTHLHKLASIERRSGSRGLVQAIFLSELKDPRGSKLPRILEEFGEPMKSRLLGIGQILAYEKITTFGRQGR